MNATIYDFPTIHDEAHDWDAERRYWDQMAAAEDYADYVAALVLADSEECAGEECDDDPKPPTPAAPAGVLVPVYRCPRCQDTGRVVKPSTWFEGQTTEGFCPDCIPHYDFAARRFRRPTA